MRKILVVIDQGHVGAKYNAGAVKGYYESSAVFKLSQYEKEYLEQYGFTVILTKKDINDDVPLYDRGQVAVRNAKGYDVVVFESNHTNAGGGYGVSVIRSAHLPKSEALGNKIAQAVVNVMRPSTGITYNRGVYTRQNNSNTADWYGVIRGAVSGALNASQAQSRPVQYNYIVEHGFHDNVKECTFLNSDANLKKIAKAKADAFAEYFSMKKQERPKETEEKFPYKVKVTCSVLNVRKSHTTASPITTEVYKGDVFTILAEYKDDGYTWGKLKSGAGYIALDYTTRV